MCAIFTRLENEFAAEEKRLQQQLEALTALESRQHEQESRPPVKTEQHRGGNDVEHMFSDIKRLRDDAASDLKQRTSALKQQFAAEQARMASTQADAVQAITEKKQKKALEEPPPVTTVTRKRPALRRWLD